MRLPFMQLESDLVAHGASTVARLAGCSVPQALGHIALLRAWAVSRATDEAPPDGLVTGDAAPRLIEAAAGWEGEKGALLQALWDAGQVEQRSDGFRVLHLNPYVTAWERNAKAKARMANARERSQNMRVTDGERSAKFGGQTQTQTQKEEDLSASRSAGAEASGEDAPTRPPLVLEPSPSDAPPEEPKKRERRLSAAEELYAATQRERMRACDKAGEPFVEDRWDNARQNKLLGPVAKGSAEERKRFEGAFGEFLADEQWKPKGWPLSLFMSGAVRSRYEKQALDAEKGAA